MLIQNLVVAKHNNILRHKINNTQTDIIYQLESQPLKSYLSKILNKTKREAKIIDSVGNAVRLVTALAVAAALVSPCGTDLWTLHNTLSPRSSKLKLKLLTATADAGSAYACYCKVHLINLKVEVEKRKEPEGSSTFTNHAKLIVLLFALMYY